MSAVRKRPVAEIKTSYNEDYMIREQSNVKKRKLLFRRLLAFTIFASVVFYFVIASLLAQASTLEKHLEEKNALEEELVVLEKEREALEDEIKKLNDDEYLAKLARRDYFLSRDGEIIFNIPKSEQDK